MSTTGPAAVVAAYYSALRASDVESWLVTFARHAEVVNPAGTPPLTGARALRELWEELTGPFQGGLDVAEDLVLVTADGAAVKWTIRAQPWAGAAVTAEGIDVFRIDGAPRITAMSSYWTRRDCAPSCAGTCPAAAVAPRKARGTLAAVRHSRCAAPTTTRSALWWAGRGGQAEDHEQRQHTGQAGRRPAPVARKRVTPRPKARGRHGGHGTLADTVPVAPRTTTLIAATSSSDGLTGATCCGQAR